VAPKFFFSFGGRKVNHILLVDSIRPCHVIVHNLWWSYKKKLCAYHEIWPYIKRIQN